MKMVIRRYKHWIEPGARTMDVYTVAFVRRSKSRRLILEALLSGTKTQADLHRLTGMYRSHVRRTIIELEDAGLVRCLNPKDVHGKMYALRVKRGVPKMLKSIAPMQP